MPLPVEKVPRVLFAGNKSGKREIRSGQFSSRDDFNLVGKGVAAFSGIDDPKAIQLQVRKGIAD